ncbi:MAG: hypothetical protein R2744_04895 [Bacteroidales bacterium]
MKELVERIGNHGRSGRTVTLKVKFDDFSQWDEEQDTA